MSGGSDLMDRVRQEQDAWLDEHASLSDVRVRLQAPPNTRRHWPVAVVLLAAVALFALGLLVRPAPTTAPEPVLVVSSSTVGSLEAGAWLSGGVTGSTLDFSDGTRIALGPNTHSELTQLHGTGATLSLHRGSLDLEVAPRPDNDWQVDAGPFSVEVTGTGFQTSWDPESEHLTVSMRHGSVMVRGPLLHEGKAVAGTEELQVWVRDGRSVLTQTPSETPDEGDDALVEVLTPEDAEPPPVPTAAPEDEPQWQDLAEEGDYAGAIALAEQAGMSEVLASASATELYALADAARLAGRHSLAATLHEAVRQRAPGSDSAAASAFALGRDALERLSDVDGAIRWWELYLAERPAGPLAAEATGRIMEAHKRAGRRKAARKSAEAYLASWPDGPHAPFARSLTRRH